MRKNWKLTISLMVIVIMTISILLVQSESLKLKVKQSELANTLGVRISDYPYPSAFPAGYYYELLKPGMTRQNVHEIISHYVFVFHCFENIEIYYFFSTNDREAIRFMLFYDQEGLFESLRGDDKNSSTIIGIDSLENRTGSCQEGVIN